ncbi:GtrA family protein [Comamonas sp. NLF-1-9]|uniref:GtrA family protein n=1 Tax=Comamonas sp. NLF-1-9 TaxID=2853163 RepID=UPI001C48EA15|nr:GtrA family protein [Comamonas sp. NLF-1-9]QXL85369.1 GtrA family protein [Comamonas sp. NLF-1-9]
MKVLPLAAPAREGAWFIAVGAGAAATHAAVFWLAQHALLAELANALGFIVAFFVSFAGHRWLSFRDAATGMGQSLLRFALTALAGFALNELVFSALLRLAHWPSWLALVAAMLVAACQTFVLGRYWAFRR